MSCQSHFNQSNEYTFEGKSTVMRIIKLEPVFSLSMRMLQGDRSIELFFSFFLEFRSLFSLDKKITNFVSFLLCGEDQNVKKVILLLNLGTNQCGVDVSQSLN